MQVEIFFQLHVNVMKTSDYYEIFPDKTIYSAQINGPQLIDSQFIDPY